MSYVNVKEEPEEESEDLDIDFPVLEIEAQPKLELWPGLQNILDDRSLFAAGAVSSGTSCSSSTTTTTDNKNKDKEKKTERVFLRQRSDWHSPPYFKDFTDRQKIKMWGIYNQDPDPSLETILQLSIQFGRKQSDIRRW